MLPPGDSSTDAILASGLLEDSDPQVRLAALLAISDQPPSSQAGRAMAAFLGRAENLNDRWLPDAATSAAATHAVDFLLACAALNDSASNLRDVSQIVANHFARSEPGDHTTRLLTSLATADPKWAGAVVAGLKNGWPEGRALPLDDAAAAALQSLRQRLSFDDQIHLVGLEVLSGSPAAQSEVQRLTDALFAQLEDTSHTIPERIKATEMIVSLNSNSAEVAARLVDLATPQTTSQVSAGLIKALDECRRGTGPARYRPAE